MWPQACTSAAARLCLHVDSSSLETDSKQDSRSLEGLYSHVVMSASTLTHGGTPVTRSVSQDWILFSIFDHKRNRLILLKKEQPK